MKVNIIGKYKWYIMGLIAAVLIMSIGLSFCVWDTTSLDINGKMNGEVANYSTIKYKYIDKNSNQNLDNGDIITDFGEYQLLVVDTYSDSYLVNTICLVGESIFSAANNNDYMVSDIRKNIRSTYTTKYGGLLSYIKPHPQLDGDKFFMMSIAEVTSGYFATAANRKYPLCTHVENKGWYGLRDKCQVEGYSHMVANLENTDGGISNSPPDDWANISHPIRVSMLLYK